MLALKNVKKTYTTSLDKVHAVDDITLELPDKGLVFIMGESGSGKTTLLNLLSGLDNCTEGTISSDADEEITSFDEKQWDTYRNKHMGIVFQSFNLIDDMTVMENLALPLRILDLPKQEEIKKVREILEYVNLSGYEDRKTYELSAGQKQRIAIARAIIKRPDILLADEPTGNLDPENSKQIFELLEEISKNCLVVVITHDNISAYKYADRIIKISAGKVIEDINNKKSKELVRYPRLFEIVNKNSGKITVEEININEFDIKKQILDEVNASENIPETVELTIKIDLREKDLPKKESIEWKQYKKVKGLSFFDILKNSIANLKKRKVRLAITIMLFAFTSMLCMLFSQIKANDYIKALSNYAENTNKNKLCAYKNIEIYESGELVSSAQLYTGEEVYKKLVDVVGEKNVIKCIQEFRIEYLTKEQKVRTSSCEGVIYNGEKSIESLSVIGRLPSEKNEVTLDKNTAKSLKITESDIGRKIFLNDEEFLLVGILEESILSDDVHLSIISQRHIDYKCSNDKMIHCSANSLVQSTALGVYINTAEYLGTIKGISSNENFTLIYGRMPENNNEILISLRVAENIGYKGDENFPTDFRIPNLYADKYNGLYDDCINMYDFIGARVKVVGIYEYYCEGEEECPGIVIDDVIYSKVRERYYEYFYNQKYIVNIDGEDIYEKLKALHEDNYKIETEASRYIYGFMEVTDELETVIISVIIVCVIMALFMMISYIVYNIKDHSKKIGVLRAIGVGNRDIIKMFLFETSFICILSAALSVIGTLVVVDVVNSKISEMISVDNLEMLMCDYKLILLIIVVVIVTGIAMTIQPLVRMTKKKSIILINNNPEG